MIDVINLDQIGYSGGTSKLKMQPVEVLPDISEAKKGIIYLIPAKDKSENDLFEEWIIINNSWENIGRGKINLSDYIKNEDLFNFTSYEYVDLGLPSGTLWAKCNLGASQPYEYGDYYMWGSTTPDTENICDWAHAPFNNGSSNYDSTYFNTHKSEWLDENDNLKPEYDAAQVAGVGRMPTEAEFRELLDNTTYVWYNDYQGSGINGGLFTSNINNNSIFIPASGGREGSSFDLQEDGALVWSSSLITEGHRDAWSLYFDSSNLVMFNSSRYVGCVIRPVSDSSSDKKIIKSEYIPIDTELNPQTADNEHVAGAKITADKLATLNTNLSGKVDKVIGYGLIQKEVTDRMMVAYPPEPDMPISVQFDRIILGADEIFDAKGNKLHNVAKNLTALDQKVGENSDSLGHYKKREPVNLAVKTVEEDKIINRDGNMVDRAGWNVAEFEAERGNTYLFNPGTMDADVCIFAEKVVREEVRNIDYKYEYNDEGLIASASATYNGTLHSYTYTYTEEGVTIIIDDATGEEIEALPLTYTASVGTYIPMTILPADAELPLDGYCRLVSHFESETHITIAVSYNAADAGVLMGVKRDGTVASICSQLSTLGKRISSLSKRVEDSIEGIDEILKTI